jgi:hypothetical protein
LISGKACVEDGGNRNGDGGSASPEIGTRKSLAEPFPTRAVRIKYAFTEYAEICIGCSFVFVGYLSIGDGFIGLRKNGIMGLICIACGVLAFVAACKLINHGLNLIDNT